jgi:hypothetical protein
MVENVVVCHTALWWRDSVTRLKLLSKMESACIPAFTDGMNGVVEVEEMHEVVMWLAGQAMRPTMVIALRHGCSRQDQCMSPE